MKRKVIILGAGIVCMSVLSSVLRDSLFHLLISFGLAVIASLCFLILAGVGILLGKRLRYARTFASIFFMLFLVCAPQMLVFPVGWALEKKDVRDAKKYCESLIPRLEEYKEASGCYPRDVDMVIDPSRRLPRLFQDDRLFSGDGFYHGSCYGFEFNFEDTGDIFGMCMYHYWSSEGVWFSDD